MHVTTFKTKRGKIIIKQSKISLNKIIQKKSIGRFSLGFFLIELSNKQTKLRLKSTHKSSFVHKNHLKTILRSNTLNGPLCFYWLNVDFRKPKINT